MKKRIVILLLSNICATFADQDILITGGTNAAVPKIAVMNIQNDGTNDNNIATTIMNDLNITGEFRATVYNTGDQIDDDTQYIVKSYIMKGTQINNNILRIIVY